MPNNDPAAVLEVRAPAFTDRDAVAIIRTHWGLDAAVGPLVSERDQNFRVDSDDGRRFVLKIANAAEDEVVTDFQIQALVYIAGRVRALDIPIRCPEVVPTLDGAVSLPISGPDGTHVTRLVTWLDGLPLGDRDAGGRLARRMGVYLAYLGRALQGFSHPGSAHSLLWDIQQASNLRPLIRHVPDAAAADAVAAALDDFEHYAQPVLPSLRAQVIHSDMNPDNVLIDASDRDTVAGVIDFGDMLHAPLVADVAVACSYLRVFEGDPLRLMAGFIAGYHGVVPLTRDEIDILFELIQAAWVRRLRSWTGGVRPGSRRCVPRSPSVRRETGTSLPAATARSTARARAATVPPGLRFRELGIVVGIESGDLTHRCLGLRRIVQHLAQRLRAYQRELAVVPRSRAAVRSSHRRAA